MACVNSSSASGSLLAREHPADCRRVSQVEPFSVLRFIEAVQPEMERATMAQTDANRILPIMLDRLSRSISELYERTTTTEANSPEQRTRTSWECVARLRPRSVFASHHRLGHSDVGVRADGL